MTDQDFRDKIVGHMAATESRLKGIEASIATIASGAACPIGIKALEQLAEVRKSDRDQWDAINGIRKPVRSAALIAGGSGMTIGGAVMWIVQHLVSVLGS
jgi:hypothetical protein